MSEWTQEFQEYYKKKVSGRGNPLSYPLQIHPDDMKILLTEIEECHAKLENVTQIFINLMYYREWNAMNFQLEKMDDYLQQIKNAIEER